MSERQASDTSNDATTVTDNREKRRVPTVFTPETAREAGKRSAEVRAEKRAQAAREGLEVVVVVPLDRIVTALSDKAQKGDTAAARELREWLARYSTQRTESVLALLTREQRAILRGWLQGSPA